MLNNRSFRRLLAGLAVSQLGDWLYNVALIAFVFDRTHSAAWLGATTAARVLPIVLLGPVAGVIADRFDRRLVMVVSDAVRMLTMLGLIAVARLGLPIVLVPLLAALATAAMSPYPSCVAATMPRLLARDQLPAANAIRSAITPLAIVGGPALGAGLLALGGSSWAFGVNAGTFVLAALLVLAIPQADAFRPSGATEREPSVWASMAVGLRELARRPEVTRLLAADLLCSFCYGVQTVALVAVSIRLGWQASGYGLLIGAIGAGGVLGAAITPRACRRLGRRAALSLALAVQGATVPLVLFTGWHPLALAVAALGGAGAIMVEVGTETALQESLPDEVFARAYGFAYPASIGGIALGSIVTAPVIALAGLPGALGIVGAITVAYALWLGAHRWTVSAASDLTTVAA